MPNVKRLLQVNLFVMVLLSSSLLGIAMESPRMIVVAVTGAVLGFVISDLLSLFHLRGLIANLASIAILFLAMRDFFSEDGTGKLIAVANLLVYLQIVLMFQDKTPRLNWQILVLSLLQVVVSAIFSLDLEGGLLLLVYFIMVGSAMLLQSVYSQQFDIERFNETSALRAMGWFGSRAASSDEGQQSPTVRTSNIGAPVIGPLTFFDHTVQKPLRLAPIAMQLFLWASVALAFTLVMFYLAPRHAPPWYGPMTAQVTTAGVSKSVNLDERDLIQQSTQLMFRVRFRDFAGNDLKLGGAPYFRGLALSDLVINNGKTDWRAPQDRVSNEHYQDLESLPSTESGNPVMQMVTLEETEDPLVYGVFPFHRIDTTPKRLEFCHEISGLTRCKIRETINLAPYKYQAGTLLDKNLNFSRYWPYISNTKSFAQRPMAEDQPQMQWLTRIEPERYETIARLSDQLAASNREQGGSMLDLFAKMENYFQSPGRFRYTLDFRRVKRDETLDPIEDFVRNHRSGHCELYASALTLMLRKQGIPARVVVGFRGGSYNDVTNSYMVRADNAHAWVEAYLPPEECTDEMREQGQAGPGGAWAILEATPIANSGSNDGEAIDIARSVWDDYVLGLDNEEEDVGAGGISMFSWLRNIDVEFFENQFQRAKQAAGQPLIKFGLPALILLVILGLIIKNSRSIELDDEEQPGLLRRMVASAISLISPELSRWVMGGRTNRVVFYQSLVEVLAQHGLTREPNQTHRDFAHRVADRFRQHPEAELIQSTVHLITEQFNAIRFGKEKLDSLEVQAIDGKLSALKAALRPSDSAVTSQV